MASQIFATVVKIDGDVVTPYKKSFDTSTLIARVESVPAVSAQTSIAYNGKRYYVTDTLATLVTNAGGTLFLCTVLQIDTQVLPTSITYAFHSTAVSTRQITTMGSSINSVVETNHQFFFCAETQEEINISINASAVNVGSAGGTALNICRSYNLARKNNPHYNAIMTTPPTIVAGGANPQTGVTNIFNGVNNSLPDSSVFTYFGGVPTIFSSTYLRFPCASSYTTGNAIGLLNGFAWRVGFVTDAPKVSIGMQGGTYTFRVIVDGQYISLTPITLSLGGRQYIDLDFTSAGGVKERTIMVEGILGSSFTTAAVGPTYKIWKMPAEAVFGIAFGDSFTTGTSDAGVFNADGFARVMGDFLGINNMWLSGSGGTGYTAPVGGPEYHFSQRVVADLISQSPQLVVLAGGINDANDATLQPAVLSLLQTIRAGLPNAVIMVLGCWAGQSGPDAGTQAKEASIKAAVQAMADKYIAFIPVSPTGNTDNSTSWVTGTGRTNSTVGDGNSDVVTGTNPPHPSQPGHLFLGEKAADAIYNAALPMT